MGTNVAMATGGFYHEEAVTGEMPTKSPDLQVLLQMTL